MYYIFYDASRFLLLILFSQKLMPDMYKIFVEDEKNTLFESVAVSIPLCSFILYNRLTSKQAPFEFMPKNLFHPLISQECPKAKADMLT